MSRPPRLSVVVPAHNAGRTLRECLAALARSTIPRALWELIVVDDGSTDDTAAIAADLADAVIKLPGKRRGPAYARNRGVEASRGDYIAFVDPSVAIQPDALQRLVTLLETRSDVGAVCGCWDPRAGQGGIATQYHALWRRFEQRTGDVQSFWAGLGAVRAQVFGEVGPFDEWLYPDPSVEDTELGHRMRLAGMRIVRLPDVRGSCLGRHGVKTVVWDHVRSRTAPGVRLALHVGNRQESRLGRTMLAGGFALLGLFALASLPFGGPGWVAAAAFFGFVASDFDGARFAASARGMPFLALALPLHVVAASARSGGAALGWCAHHLVGPPRVPIEFLAGAGSTAPAWPPRPVQPSLSVWTRPPRRSRRRRVAA